MSSTADGVLDPGRVIARLADEFPRPRRYLVAFSGGLDSTVLLHLLVTQRDRLAAPVEAVHVDHGLQPAASTWGAHCRAACTSLDVALTTLCVDARPAPGQSPEAAAREARYAAVADVFGSDDMLLTAHHLDDQAETVMLQLLRGAGVDGLAGMPPVRPWRNGWHARPLLDVSREAIRAWAVARQLDWVEDPSNAQPDADRNYLRHVVMPALRARWPAVSGRFAHSAALAGEAALLLREQAAVDLAGLGVDQPDQLSLSGWCALGSGRARRVMRLWLRQLGLPPLPARRLHEAWAQLCGSRGAADVEIAWSGYALRRYRGRIWVGRRRLPPVTAQERRRAWSGEPMRLGEGRGSVSRAWGPAGIDPRHWERARVEIGHRHAGLRCRPAGRGGSRSFKNLVQECAIPPWLRDRLPVVWIDGEVAAIADCCVAEAFAAARGESGWHVHWQRPGLHPDD